MPFDRPPIIRPPSERMSYYLPMTGGCSNNTCTFCAYCRSKLRIRELQGVKEEIDALALYTERGIRVPAMPGIVYAVAQQWDGRRVFLQDGDALVYPFPGLLEALQHLNQRFPGLERVSAYATAQDILRRSPDELRTLRDHKLGILYMGVETGHHEILDRVDKRVTYDQMVEAAKKAKDAGIILSVTVILGLGGVELSREHAVETARILTDIDPEYAGALTLTLVPETPLYEQAQRGEFNPISPFQSLEELSIMIENASFTDCFFSSMHASNYLAVRGSLPRDRQRMLKELEDILASKDPRLLRPEFMRGL